MRKFAEFVSKVDLPALNGRAIQFYSIHAQYFMIESMHDLKINGGKSICAFLDNYRTSIETIVGRGGFASKYLFYLEEEIKNKTTLTKDEVNDLLEVIVDFEENYVKHYIA